MKVGFFGKCAIIMVMNSDIDKQEKLTVPVLKKRLDQLLKVVRYDGSEDGITNICITCGRKFEIKDLQCGHFIKRGNLYLKYNPKNLGCQCCRCNHFLDGAQDKMAYFICKQRGEEVFYKLVEQDFMWQNGELPSLKRNDYVSWYNYWLLKNRLVEDKFKIKLIPTSWHIAK